MVKTRNTKLLIVNRLVRFFYSEFHGPSYRSVTNLLRLERTFRCRRLLAAGGGIEQAAGVWLMFGGFDDGRHEYLMSSLSWCCRSHVFLGFEMSGCSTKKSVVSPINLYT